MLQVVKHKKKKNNLQEIRMKKVTFGPTVDKESENPFLPASPMELIHRGNNIPILLGYTSHEYLKFIPGIRKRRFRIST